MSFPFVCPFCQQDHNGRSTFMAGRFTPLTQASLYKTLRTLLSRAGLDQSQYASHSFRIGTATTAATVRMLVWMIKNLGCWISNGYLSYIHCSPSLTSEINEPMARTDATNQPPWDADQPTLIWRTTLQMYLSLYVTSALTPLIYCSCVCHY